MRDELGCVTDIRAAQTDSAWAPALALALPPALGPKTFLVEHAPSLLYNAFMERTIAVTDEEYNTIIVALNVTAVRYEEESKTKPHMAQRAKQMRDTYQSLLRYMENQLRPEN